MRGYGFSDSGSSKQWGSAMKPPGTETDGAHSTIVDILDDTMKRAKGLDYVVFAIMLPAAGADPVALQASIQARSRGSLLDSRLKRFALRGRTSDEQAKRWEMVLQRVITTLAELDQTFINAGQGANSRVVFDVDMGGYFLTRIGHHAVLFGATLDQAEVNGGRCEREMYHIVSQIEVVFTAQGA